MFKESKGSPFSSCIFLSTDLMEAECFPSQEPESYPASKNSGTKFHHETCINFIFAENLYPF